MAGKARKTATKHLQPGDVYKFNPIGPSYLHLEWRGGQEHYANWNGTCWDPQWDDPTEPFVYVVAHGKDLSWNPTAP